MTQNLARMPAACALKHQSTLMYQRCSRQALGRGREGPSPSLAQGISDMSPLLAVILICKIGIAPADCTRDTASDVKVVAVPSSLACMMTGQISTAHDGMVAPGSYLMVRCMPRHRQRSAAAQ